MLKDLHKYSAGKLRNRLFNSKRTVFLYPVVSISGKCGLPVVLHSAGTPLPRRYRNDVKYFFFYFLIITVCLICLPQDPPFVKTKMNEDGTFSHEGYCIDLLNELARILKFTYEMYPSPDGHYGTITENGTWDGMIKEILNGVLFIGPCILLIPVYLITRHPDSQSLCTSPLIRNKV